VILETSSVQGHVQSFGLLFVVWFFLLPANQSFIGETFHASLCNFEFANGFKSPLHWNCYIFYFQVLLLFQFEFGSAWNSVLPSGSGLE